MKAIIINVDLATVDVDGIFENQTLGGAGDVSLDGAEVVAGEWITPDGFAKQIAIDSAGDVSGVVFTVTGYTDQDKHNLITETITGVTTTAVESTNYFYSITSIAADGAVASNIFAGSVDEAVTKPLPISWRGGVASVNLDITGTMDVTIENTFDELQNLDDLNFAWQDSPSINLVNATTSTNDAYEGLPSALRLKVNSYSAGAACNLTIRQRDV